MTATILKMRMARPPPLTSGPRIPTFCRSKPQKAVNRPTTSDSPLHDMAPGVGPSPPACGPFDGRDAARGLDAQPPVAPGQPEAGDDRPVGAAGEQHLGPDHPGRAVGAG